MESAYTVAVQKPEMHGPPVYFTTDFEAARRSVQILAGRRARSGRYWARARNAPTGNAGRAAWTREDFDRYAVPERQRPKTGGNKN